ncbi:beta-1,4-N-acetylgalactosaminyltransferase 3-like isoform X1 [Acropora millepora]|uniref:beta-1,4-N-acetylgalactosaminyltransferase 3-like isoform X1 n=1 Tax=Acropora millepora TaxID=45264 RepID=UPI001CF5A0ED|nr:beta-1,4-N-acetylgalactosaminyltransferase 3-like isoform X1 [Acropora millepora]
MKLQTLKLALVFGSFVIALIIIVSEVCMLGRYECFAGFREIKSTKDISSFFKHFLFQEPLDLLENDENISSRGLNQHVWDKNCIKTIASLCNFPMFPNAPDKRQVIYRTEITEQNDSTTDAHRIFGFIRPNLTGDYQFAVASNGYAEVWLSESANWNTAKEIAYLKLVERISVTTTVTGRTFNVSRKQISSRIYLKAKTRYYIEILYALGIQSKGEYFLRVSWKHPQESNFVVIESDSLFPFKNDSKAGKQKMYDDELPNAKSCNKDGANQGYKNKHMNKDQVKIPFLEHTSVSKVLPSCEYRPSYLPDAATLKSFRQYHGVFKHVKKIHTFPFSFPEGVVLESRHQRYSFAQLPLQEEEAWSVVEKYMDSLKKSYFERYTLHSITRVEKKEDQQKGARYFIEVILSHLLSGKKYNLAEYVFQPKGNNLSMCYPQGMQWNKTTDVYLILTAKNLGRWVHHFIKNMENIVQETNDEHLHVIIYDFDSGDIDIKRAFQRTILKNYHFITKPGKYSRVTSLKEAIESVKNPDSIVVSIDMHLDIGSQFIDEIRKHCIRGKTVYAPEIVFLNCGGSSSKPKGSWCHAGYGTIAMYKQDWDNFGGFSPAFLQKTTWGGEDWDLIDNAVKGSLEIERNRSPWVYHYYHVKAGMWNN